MFVDNKKNLNRTLAIDSPLQTFAVGRICRLALGLLSLEMFSSLCKLTYLMHTLLYLSEG